MKLTLILTFIPFVLLAVPVGPTLENPKIKGLSAGAASTANLLKVDPTTGALTYVDGATSLSGYAPLNSPTFTGTPLTTTAAVDTNTTQIASTAFVIGQGYLKSATASGIYQPLDTDLTTIAGLSPTTNNVIQSVAGAWASRTPAQLKSTLALSIADVSGLQAALDLKLEPSTEPIAQTFNFDLTLAGAATSMGSGFDVMGGSGSFKPGSFLVLDSGSAVNFDSTSYAYGAGAAAAHRAALGFGTFLATSGTSSGANTGDQTSIVGITGTLAQFNTAVTGADFASLAGTETLTNKSLDDATTWICDNTDATKKAQFQLSGITTGTTRTFTLPDADATLVGLATTQTLTNKDLTSATNTFPTKTFDLLYPILANALSPADATTYYMATWNSSPATTAGQRKTYIRDAGTIVAAEIFSYAPTAGSNENISYYIRVNDTTDTLIATVGSATNERVYTNTALSIAISAGDYIEIKIVCPTWATNPVSMVQGGTLKFRPN